MHLQKKIYEAIQKGLSNALDFSFGDEDNSILTKKHTSDDQIVKPFEDALWIKENFVDLGLPSGTLWCKYNLGATNEDTPESWYGHYYMWGSTKPNNNDNCCWQNTPFNNGKSRFSKTYFREHMYEFVNQLDNLLLEHDIAYQTNKLMHIPTKEQIKELVQLPNEWIENYNDIKDLNGRVFTGTNGNELFIPAAGLNNKSVLQGCSSDCYMWSSTLNTGYPGYAYTIGFYSGSIHLNYGERCNGFSVRGVISK